MAGNKHRRATTWRFVWWCAAAAGALIVAGYSSGSASASSVDGGHWVNVSGSSNPPAGEGNSMAFDPATGQVVWFGAAPASAGPAQTWVWSGRSWSRLSPAYSPPYLDEASLAFDAATNQLVLFGGSAYQEGPRSGTWSWNGSTWSALSPAHHPDRRAGAALAYDPASRQLVLFGGSAIDSAGTSEVVNDTWDWTGFDWVQQSPHTAPSPRYCSAMTFDPRSKDLVLYGGANSSGTYFTGTWEWNGTNWAQVVSDGSTNTAGRRCGASLGYDPSTSQLVVFGGVGGGTGTWDWTGTAWKQLPTGTEPADRWWAPITYDPRSGNLLLAGGGDFITGANYTWSWVPSIAPTPSTTEPNRTSSSPPNPNGSPTTLPSKNGHSPATNQTHHFAAPSTTLLPPTTSAGPASPLGAAQAASGPAHTAIHSSGSILPTALLVALIIVILGSGSGAYIYRRHRRRPPPIDAP